MASKDSGLGGVEACNLVERKSQVGRPRGHARLERHDGSAWTVLQRDPSIGENHHPDAVRMIDGDDDESAAREIFNQDGVNRARYRIARREEHNRPSRRFG